MQKRADLKGGHYPGVFVERQRQASEGAGVHACDVTRNCIAPTALREFGVFAVEGGGLLEGAGSLEGGGVVAGAGDELEADGEIFFGEAAGDGNRGQAAKIPYGTEGVGEGEAGDEIQIERSGRDGLRSGDENVVSVEDGAHFPLQEVADAEGVVVVAAGDALADVTSDAA